MELVAINQVLVKLLLLALNLMPHTQAAFNFHVLQDGVYAATYRVERRDQDFTVFRPRAEAAEFPAFDAERSRRFGRSYTVRVQDTGEMLSLVLTDILRDMPPLSSAPRQILKTADSAVKPEETGEAQSAEAPPEAKPAAGLEAATQSSGDIRIDGVGRTLFLTVDGQNLTVAAEISESL